MDRSRKSLLAAAPMRWPTARACAPCGCPKRATGAKGLSAAATHEDRPSLSPTSSVPRRRPPRLGSPTSAGASRTAGSVRRVSSPAHGFVGRRRAEALHDCFASTARVRQGTRRRSSASRVTVRAVMGLSASLCRSSHNPCVTCGALARGRRAVTFGCVTLGPASTALMARARPSPCRLAGCATRR